MERSPNKDTEKKDEVSEKEEEAEESDGTDADGVVKVKTLKAGEFHDFAEDDFLDPVGAAAAA